MPPHPAPLNLQHFCWCSSPLCADGSRTPTLASQNCQDPEQDGPSQSPARHDHLVGLYPKSKANKIYRIQRAYVFLPNTRLGAVQLSVKEEEEAIN